MALHIMAVVQLRNPTEGKRYYDRKVAAGKTPNEAMRCTKRRLSDIVYRTMLDDLVTTGAAPSRTGPGGHRGNVSASSAAGSHPHTSSSDKSLPGPATTKPRTTLPRAS
jgi:transposase